jgi:hypothetical protein
MSFPACVAIFLLGFHLFLLWIDDKLFLANFVKYGNVLGTMASMIVLKDNVIIMPFELDFPW